jgi:hypothetical protein
LLLGCGGMIALLILLVLIVSIGASKAPPGSTMSSPKTLPNTAPQTLLDLQGSGSKTTQKFTARGDWDLAWTYDCSSFGAQGNFVVMVYNGDGSMSFQNSALNQIGTKGSDVQHYHTGGTFYLDINSECSWSLKTTG